MEETMASTTVTPEGENAERESQRRREVLGGDGSDGHRPELRVIREAGEDPGHPYPLIESVPRSRPDR